jgi:alpha-1,3-glucosyltransferase
MRWSVLVLDLLFLFPAVYLIYRQWSPTLYRNKALFYGLVFVALLKPDQILIDHGHFQYNCLMLGLILYAFYFMIVGKRYLSCFMFTLAINAKLMGTYFSLAFLAGLIGLTLRRHDWASKKSKVIQQVLGYGVVVVGTTLVLWFPWIYTGEVKTVLSAIFPVHRGLYQLKVPNFWCISDVLVKWDNVASKPVLAGMCGFLCIGFSLPSMLALIVKPSQKVLAFSFSCISMTFFMFSYHVHEKSILIPLCIVPFLSQFIGGSLVIDLILGGCVGMHHLLCEDGQQLQYFVLVTVYVVMATALYSAEESFMNIYHQENRSSPMVMSNTEQQLSVVERMHIRYWGMWAPMRVGYVYGGFVVLHLMKLLITPPESLPYLWNLLFAFYAFVLNGYFLVLGNLVLVNEIKIRMKANKSE